MVKEKKSTKSTAALVNSSFLLPRGAICSPRASGLLLASVHIIAGILSPGAVQKPCKRKYLVTIVLKSVLLKSILRMTVLCLE